MDSYKEKYENILFIQKIVVSLQTRGIASFKSSIFSNTCLI